MTIPAMTSLQRVLTTLGHQEPDRVPLFLSLTLHGAKELDLSIQDYFAKADTVIEGQLRLRKKYGHDCLLGYCYAPLEIEAWGGEVIFVEDGPPNSALPFLDSPEKILRLAPPEIDGNPHLLKILQVIAGLKAVSGDECPVLGLVISPFSLPVMQMGFDRYLDLMMERPELFERLMQVNEAFCVAWANAQLKAGATAICYFDPVSSPTIVPRETYLRTGFAVAKRTLARIQGPTATHLASGRTLPILGDIARTGTAVVGVSCQENLSEVKAACRGKLTVLGNLNGIAMRRWDQVETEAAVRRAITEAGPGGGFILSDNHGEIPWQVSDDVLMTIAESVRRWGRYPLEEMISHGA